MDLRKHRRNKTILLGLQYFAMGMFAEISGPTLADLRFLYQTKYETLTEAMAGRGIGGIIGALVGGAMVHKYEDKPDICLALLATMSAMGVLYTPLAADVIALWYGYFVQGFTLCVMNIVSTRLILKLWEERSSTMLQIILMVYGMGALVVPLICSPFLKITMTTEPGAVYALVETTLVHVPYMIVSAYLLFVAVLFFVSHFKLRSPRALNISVSSKNDLSTNLVKLLDDNKTQHYTRSQQDGDKARHYTWSQYLNPATYAHGNVRYGISVLVLLFIYYFNYAGCEKVFVNFLRTLSVDVFGISKSQASYLNTLFWCSFTAGRCLVSILTRFIPTRVLVLLNVLLHFGSVWLLKNFAANSLSLFLMLTFIEGMLMAPLFGLVISFGNTLIEVKGVCLTVIILAGSSGQWFYLKNAGTLYDDFGPESVLHWIGVPSAMLLISAGVLVLVSMKK